MWAAHVNDGRHRRLYLRRRLTCPTSTPPHPLPRWVNSTSIPGEYTTPPPASPSLAPWAHHTRIFYDGPLGATTSDRPGRTRPNPVYSSESRAQMLDAVAFLLWRGVSRLQDALLPLLGSIAASQLDHLSRWRGARRLVPGLLPQRALDGGGQTAADRVASSRSKVQARDELAQISDAHVPARAAPRTRAWRRQGVVQPAWPSPPRTS